MKRFSDLELVEALLISPAGAALLGGMELSHRRRLGGRRRAPWTSAPDSVKPDAVARAVAGLGGYSLGTMLAAAVYASDRLADAENALPEDVYQVLRDSSARRGIAEAFVELWGRVLQEKCDRRHQEWWFDEGYRFDSTRPLGGCHGVEEAWITAEVAAFWTMGSPPDELHAPILDASSLEDVTRWHLRVDSAARVYEVNSPADWEELVREYPLGRHQRPGSNWEIPGPGQDEYLPLGPLTELEGQRAIRTEMQEFIEPDWDLVSRDWDGIHLTWAGFITTEGLIIDLGDGRIAMLRGWQSERTLWLNPVLTHPEALVSPLLGGSGSADELIDEDSDVEVFDIRSDPDREARDREWLSYRLSL